MSEARAKASHHSRNTATSAIARLTQPTPSQGEIASFGEFTCDATKRFEASPAYSFERTEIIVPNIFVKVKYQGWVFFPAVNGMAVAGPIVILCHGAVFGGTPAGFYQKNYLYLMRCLASNGMVAISIDSRATAKDQGKENSGNRAEKIVVHLKNIVKEIKLQKGIDLKGQQLVLLGHSQGGEAAVIAADVVRKGLVADFTVVKAVVALAPRFTPAKFKYARNFAESFLVMHGAVDLDIVDGGGINLYEHADPVMVYKGLVWILGGTHAGFFDATLLQSKTDGNQNPPHFEDILASLAPVSQNWLTVVYTLEFLRWRLGLKGTHQILRGFFLPSKANAPAVPPDSHEVILQPPLFSDTSLKELWFNDVAVSSGFTAVLGPVFGISQVCNTCINGDRGYRLKWDLAKHSSPFIRFSFPVLGPKALLEKSLLFNAVRVVDSNLNTMTDPLFLRVSLGATGLGNSQMVTIKIPDSQPLKTILPNTFLNISRTVMGTLNIVLGSFPGITPLFLDKLSSVTFSFSGTSKTGDVILATPRISLV